MAQWDNLGRAATIAQLAGVDALGLISTILQAAQTVRHNRETCQELVQDLQMMEDLLKLLREPEMMRQDEIKNVLNGLDRTLKEADSLVKSCRDCSLAYRVFMGWKQSDQFRRVKKKIAKHLKFYPMVSHADITRRLEELGKSVQSSSSSQQEAQEGRQSSTSSQNPEARNRVGTPPLIEIEPVENEIEPAENEIEPLEIEMTKAGSESTTVGEHQQAGNNVNNGSFPTKKWRFGLKLPLSRKQWSGMALKKGKVETPSFLSEFAGPDFTFFHFTQLAAATNDFASDFKIQGWGYDDFYKGQLADGIDIMIKRGLYPNNSGRLEKLKNDVQFLAKLRHMNIVKLIGCCYERGEALLVYEYMENGRLTDAITSGTGERFLNWSKRFKIIIGIARGLLYLHECCGMHIVVGNYGPLCILLDSHMTPKITDFTDARHFYLDEHGSLLHGQRGYSVRYDVFRFGLTLLGIITVKSVAEIYNEIYNNEDDDFPGVWTVEKTERQIYPALHGEPRMSEIIRCIQVATLCIVSDENDPLSMWDVLLMLSCESVVIPEVPRPSESPQSHNTFSTYISEYTHVDVGLAHHDGGELSDSDIVEAR